MAGSRTRNGRPRTRDARLANRRAARVAHMELIATADTPGRRLGAAVNYLRSALGAVDGDQAERKATEVVTYLVATADALLSPSKQRRPR